MLRTARIVLPKANVLLPSGPCSRWYATSKPGKSGSSKIFVSLIATAGFGLAGTIVYGKYDPNFKTLLENNIPYMKEIYKWLPDLPSKDSPLQKIKETTDKVKKEIQAPDEKISYAKIPSKTSFKEPKMAGESRIAGDKSVDEDSTLKVTNLLVNDNLLKESIKKVEKYSAEAVSAYQVAVKAVEHHTKKLYEAIDFPNGKHDDVVWKEANDAAKQKKTALNIATQKTLETQSLLEKLKSEMKRAKDLDGSLLKAGEETILKVQSELTKAEQEVAAALNDSKTASEYKNLISKSKEQFLKELEVVLPKYQHHDKDQTTTEEELNLLIAHAHRRIEQLQKQIARQQLTEKAKIDEALHFQKLQDEKMVDSKVEAELSKQKMDLETAVQYRVASLKEELEVELRHQLRRQAAAHLDHLQEMLKVQQQEQERQHTLELEEKLLHQKGVFISEVSGSMAHLKGIATYMKAKSEFDQSSKKAQALWLACQAMEDKLKTSSPMAKELAAIKILAGEESEFVNCILASIPAKAIQRGVSPKETLKQRFHKVKQVCRQVALVDDKNNSLYKYFMSYLQSLLIVDAVSIPPEELSGQVAVDPREWDNFDILNRLSYSLRVDDLEQALRYANQLKGEAKVVAQDWVAEMRLLLETQLAVQALLTHAAAVGVQAYH